MTGIREFLLEVFQLQTSHQIIYQNVSLCILDGISKVIWYFEIHTNLYNAYSFQKEDNYESL